MAEIKFWKDDKKEKIEPTLFSEQAEKLAKKLAEDNKSSKGRKENKRTQIRKFYDEVLRLDMEAKNPERKWDDISPFVHMLVAKTAYAKGRELVSDDFFKFIELSVKQISEPKDLSVFANFFEALMGFYRLHGPAN